MAERFLQADCLPVELVDRLQRKVRAAYSAVADDPEQAATVTVRFYIQADRGEIDGTYTLEQKFADRKTSEMGKIRDGQLMLPGTELRSDEPPSALSWESRMLAHPALETAG